MYVVGVSSVFSGVHSHLMLWKNSNVPPDTALRIPVPRRLVIVLKKRGIKKGSPNLETINVSWDPRNTRNSSVRKVGRYCYYWSNDFVCNNNIPLITRSSIVGLSTLYDEA